MKDRDRGINLEVLIDGKPVSFLLDTGASVTLISEELYQERLAHMPMDPCQYNYKLNTYTGEKIPTVGQVTVPVQSNGQNNMLPLVIVRGKKPSLLGWNWLNKMK